MMRSDRGLARFQTGYEFRHVDPILSASCSNSLLYDPMIVSGMLSVLRLEYTFNNHLLSCVESIIHRSSKNLPTRNGQSSKYTNGCIKHSSQGLVA